MDRVTMCPICLDPLTAPIIQCERGHSVHGECIQANNLDQCPECRGAMAKTRNFAMEQLIEKMADLRLPCYHSDRGCKYMLSRDEKTTHELQCRHRLFRCEGHHYAKWKCTWMGTFSEILKHFETAHPNCQGDFKMTLAIPLVLDRSMCDLKAISFFNGTQIFWYKYKTDVEQQKMYWTFQMVGTSKQAEHYYYEFEIVVDPVRKYKITEVCGSDTTPNGEVFKEGRCVCLSFNAAKEYAHDGKLTVHFRIMTIKKSDKAKGKIESAVRMQRSPALAAMFQSTFVGPYGKR